MFRLVKILNGRTNQAEPIFLPMIQNEEYQLGEALSLVNEGLTKCKYDKTPTHIAVCDGWKSEESETLPVYPVIQGMIFECPIIGETSSLCVGDKVALTDDGMGVTTVASGMAVIRKLGDGNISEIMFDLEQRNYDGC
jgi:hypothetical protein